MLLKSLMSQQPRLPPCLLGPLFELEALQPDAAAASIASALDASAAPVVGSAAASEVFSFAARLGLNGDRLRNALQNAGLGDDIAAMLSDHWAALPSRASLLDPSTARLVNVDWSFGGASHPTQTSMSHTFWHSGADIHADGDSQ